MAAIVFNVVFSSFLGLSNFLIGSCPKKIW